MNAIKLLTSLLVSILATISISHAQAKLDVFNQFNSESITELDHTAWAEFLLKYVETTSDNRTLVAYSKVTEVDREALQSYLDSLQATDPTMLNRDEAYAYWVNLYNGATVDIILDKYPVRSILKISSGFRPGPWKRNLLNINGVKLTLDNIEHGVLRSFWDDNRVHYAVNCAAYSCPNLTAVPFTGANLNDLLTEGARAYINHPRAIRFDNGRVTASSIYKWYKEDFGGDNEGVITHMKQYAEPDLKAQLDAITKINRHRYDWTLNEPSDLN